MRKGLLWVLMMVCHAIMASPKKIKDSTRKPALFPNWENRFLFWESRSMGIGNDQQASSRRTNEKGPWKALLNSGINESLTSKRDGPLHDKPAEPATGKNAAILKTCAGTGVGEIPGKALVLLTHILPLEQDVP